MLSHQENDLLTQVGSGTPMGNLLRHYWIPALLSDEVPYPDCPPVQVRLLGEKLVAFPVPRCGQFLANRPIFPRVSRQDSCVTESMGPICDRTREHLGASDKSVIAIRRYLLMALKTLEKGGEPPGIVRDPAKIHQHVISQGAVLSAGSSWRQLLK